MDPSCLVSTVQAAGDGVMVWGIIYFIIMFYFSFLHFPLSGPVLTKISLPIIHCMIVYVTNNKEP